MPQKPLDLIAKYRARLDKQNQADLDRLIAVYGRMTQRLQDKVDLLLYEIEQNPNASIKQMQRYKDLVQSLNYELEKYNVYLETELDGIKAKATSQARLDTAVLIAAALTARGLSVPPSKIPISPAPVSVLAEGSAAYKRLHELAPVQAQRIIDNMLKGIQQGWGFKKLGNEIVNDLGLGLSDAMRWARTVQMEAYRETSHNTMQENGAIIDGWTWFAQIDDATCDDCRDQHGSEHTPDESVTDLTSHIWNCRCVELPHVVGDDNPITGNPVESE